MSITILNEIDKAKVLADGLRKNLDKVQSLGVTAQQLDRLEQTYGELKSKDDALEALRRQATLRVRENNEMLADLKAQMLAVRKVVKEHFPQQEWLAFGVQDKR